MVLTHGVQYLTKAGIEQMLSGESLLEHSGEMEYMLVFCFFFFNFLFYSFFVLN